MASCSWRIRLSVSCALVVSLWVGCTPLRPTELRAQSDLDAFMERVVTRRDENWKKLQQYILDERETIDVLGPGGVRVWGERREYTWFIRDGFFVRSPLEVNGVKIGEDDRRRYEAEYLRREQRRERRATAADPGAPAAGDPGVGADVAAAERVPTPGPDAPPTDLGALVGQARQPEFIRAAYFLRFKFDQGRYALVGRETLEGREVLRVEYYPTRLFPDSSEREQRRRSDRDRDDPTSREIQRLMNKTSLVTLWVDPSSHQILKYVFDNVDLDFLPGRWLAQVNEVEASMSMGRAFPDVWLPSSLELRFSLTLAVGRFDMRYALEYHDYRQADVTTKIAVPGAR